MSQNNAMKTRKPSIGELDFIRSICAIGIIVFHFFCHTPDEVPKVFYTYANGSWGTALVGVFLIISGGVMYYNYNQITLFRQFYYKRWKTLFPMFYVAYLYVYIERVLAAKRFFYRGNPLSLLWSVFGLDGYFNYLTPTYYILGEWFLGAIIMIYIVYPVFMKLVNKLGIWFWVAWLMLWMWQLQSRVFEVAVFKNMIHCIGLFITGMIVFKYDLYKNKYIIAASVVICGILTCAPFRLFLPVYTEIVYIFSLFFTLLGIGKLAIKTTSGRKICKILSNLSYPIFLVQHVVDRKIINAFSPVTASQTTLCVAMAIILSVFYAWCVKIIANSIMSTKWFGKIDKIMMGNSIPHKR